MSWHMPIVTGPIAREAMDMDAATVRRKGA